MNRDELLKHIAETAYNVGIGAKKHFATYDIVEKAPGLISFVSLAFGIYSIALDGLSTKFLSSSFVVLGIIGIYVSRYENTKADYERVGVELTKIFNKLGRLYRAAKSAEDEDLINIERELVELESEFYGLALSNQILLSDWYAHFKFFWQHQIDWVNEQKRFRFFRDKIPLSLLLVVVVVGFVLALNLPIVQALLCQGVQ